MSMSMNQRMGGRGRSPLGKSGQRGGGSALSLDESNMFDGFEGSNDGGASVSESITTASEFSAY